ncbi:MAG: 2-oxoacid:acceptor oxidoreductase subunit alpha [Pseudomonadota bacterium]
MELKHSSNTVTLLIGGEAGQGIATVGNIFTKCLVRSGYSIVVTQSYQSRIRGGHNTYAIRIGTDKVIAPDESVDILIALNQETAKIHEKELSNEGLIIIDEVFEFSNDSCIKVPFKQLGTGIFSNIVALGVVSSIIGLNEDVVSEIVNKFLGKMDQKTIERNQQVIVEAFKWTNKQSISFQKLPKISNPPDCLVMNGNEAIALGALSAGLKFYSFYPMTPATSIAVTLAGKAKRMGIIVEQAEDEISAINMALGASFAGAASMVSTSGGGFALMVEGISLAAMTETPIVIVIAQRPAPATGLPTRTEQSDLEFVLHSGHGEFPRAIFTPGTIEDCFHLTHKAFELSERYQSPVFILTDQFLADSYRNVKPFDINNLSAVNPGFHENIYPSPYRRYSITKSGVSPRLLPGNSEHLVIVDSDEHTEDGHITEDLTVRINMVNKRLQKEKGIINDVIKPWIYGDEKPDLLMVCWGSSKGAVIEAASNFRSRGKRVSTLHFSQVWPLVPEHFISHLQEARDVVCIEGNATGQMARLIRRETGFLIEKKVLRYDGLPITPEYILEKLTE